MDGTVTVASMDTLTMGGWQGKVAIHGWSMDGTVTGIVIQAGQGLHPWMVHG